MLSTHDLVIMILFDVGAFVLESTVNELRKLLRIFVWFTPITGVDLNRSRKKLFEQTVFSFFFQETF